jgi:hypothetical protein
MSSRSSSSECLIDILPDNILLGILVRAASTGELPAPEFKRLAQLRMVSSRLNRLVPQVDCLVCRLDAARMMDARVIFFLQEADNIRTLHLEYDFEDELQTVSGAFLAGALGATKSLERFRLKYGSFCHAGPVYSDELGQQLFKALSKCRLLRVVDLATCVASVTRPLSMIERPFHNLKAFRFTAQIILTASALSHFVHKAAPVLEELHIEAVRGLIGDVKIVSSTLQVLLLKPLEEFRDKLEISTPHLHTLTLANTTETWIDAPELRNLTIDRFPQGPIVRVQPWKVRKLHLGGVWKEEKFLQLLELCKDAEFVHLYLSLETTDISEADRILWCLKGIRHLDVSGKFLRCLKFTVEGTCVPSICKLSKLTVDVRNNEDFTAALKLVKASPNLTYLKVSLFELEGRLVNVLTQVLQLKNEKPGLVIEVDEPPFVSADHLMNSEIEEIMTFVQNLD